jgi:hypothetical protein
MYRLYSALNNRDSSVRHLLSMVRIEKMIVVFDLIFMWTTFDRWILVTMDSRTSVYVTSYQVVSCVVVLPLVSTVHSSFLLFFPAVTQDRSFQHCKLFLILIINQVKSSPSLQLHAIINISGDFWVELPSWKWRVLTAYKYNLQDNKKILVFIVIIRPVCDITSTSDKSFVHHCLKYYVV